MDQEEKYRKISSSLFLTRKPLRKEKEGKGKNKLTNTRIFES